MQELQQSKMLMKKSQIFNLWYVWKEIVLKSGNTEKQHLPQIGSLFDVIPGAPRYWQWFFVYFEFSKIFDILKEIVIDY